MEKSIHYLEVMIKKYSSAARWIYLMMLVGGIGIYFLVYFASGHEFNPPVEDYFSLLIVFLAYVYMVAYTDLKLKKNKIYFLLKSFVFITLLITNFFAIKILIFLIEFKFGDDVSVFERVLTFLLPIIFIIVSIINALSLFEKYIKIKKRT
ncbi:MULTISPECIES: hypothetical protein [unclassified Tenacibaculum]|uniref:hypothetical protein n=1 Tax=unclassified Tenacibaculum TaxID=2635139 RepID=UPI001F19FC48|nr:MULTISPECIES: hypothetical protein [unclassified Tenacibaculum]MCF2873116.1 hypothetical protein [Tenacibaculum sp. Cn5-1]MCF2933272.1 hypothetical protein [Tenacibaculum sp. Cn5-34]MCG7510147.1 hypothetical protein [Tenacibaculum sp. Cn5-46]